MNITNIVIRKKIINLIINLIVIIFCLINFFFNMNNNLMAITGNYIQIHSLDDININNKFYNIDMQTASKEMYDIESEGIKASMYTIKIDDTNVLVILKYNTLSISLSIGLMSFKSSYIFVILSRYSVCFE